jgi:hypothetical protein
MELCGSAPETVLTVSTSDQEALQLYVNDPNDANSITAGGVFTMRTRAWTLYGLVQKWPDLMSKSDGIFIHFKNNAIDSENTGLVVALLTEETGNVWVAHRNGGGLDFLITANETIQENFLKAQIFIACS